MALLYMPVTSPVLVLLGLAVVCAAIYWTGARVPVPQERFVVALVVAIALGGSVIAHADVILQFCTEAWLREWCGENWYWCGVLRGCWFPGMG